MADARRRDVILRAAERLFEHYGHAKTTMADVAREAQIGVGSVYLEFDSKEAIVEALSGSVHIAVLGAMRKAAEKEREYARKFTAVLAARTKAFLDLRRKGQHACELVHCKTTSVQVAHDRFREQEHALLVEVLERGRLDESFGRFDVKVTATLVQKAFACLTPPALYDVADDAVALSSQMASLLLQGIAARAATSLSVPSRKLRVR